jgi:hypothetical protein
MMAYHNDNLPFNEWGQDLPERKTPGRKYAWRGRVDLLFNSHILGPDGKWYMKPQAVAEFLGCSKSDLTRMRREKNGPWFIYVVHPGFDSYGREVHLLYVRDSVHAFRAGRH